MKKALFTLAIMLLALAAQAQTSLKVHSNGTVSLQSASTTGGVQFQTNGYTSFEPNISTAYGRLGQTKPMAVSSKCWIVCNSLNTAPYGDTFYVTTKGNVYYYHLYNMQTPRQERGSEPIENAIEIVSQMKGYYTDSDEFSGNPEDLENNENISPDAVEGLIRDMEKGRSIVMDAEELEPVLPEAVRHTAEGTMGINYNAVVTVLVEAFKEQQARIEQLEAVLRENGLLERKR